MAFNKEELKIIEWSKKNGKSRAELEEALSAYRTGRWAQFQYEQKQNQIKVEQTPLEKESFMSEAVSRIKDIPSDIKESFAGATEAVSGAMEKTKDISSRVVEGETTPRKGAFEIIGAGLGAGAKVVGEAFTGAGKIFLSPKEEQALKDIVETGATKVVETKKAQDLMKWYADLPEEQKRTVNASLGVAEGVGTMLGAGPGIKITREAINKTIAGVEIAAKNVKAFDVPKIGSPVSFFKRRPATIEDAIDMVDENINNLKSIDEIATKQEPINIDEVSNKINQLIEERNTAEALALARETSSNLTVKEKFAGLRPDIKQRIEGKEDLMREYFDVTHARNYNDRLPTIQEYAGDYARRAGDIMQEKLNDVGGDIGKIRTKLGNVKASRDDVVSIDNLFTKELSKLNLRVKNGKISQIPGTQNRLDGSGDLKALQELYNELNTLKQSPKLTNIIDLRMNFDGKINFAKSQREVSNSVDPLSRQMRNEFKRVSNNIVGKQSASDVEKYSNFMQAYNDITSFTDRKAGGEYLLRLVMSGRGGEARQIIQTIKEYTSIDLMDHATMMQISNELIANEAQKNLFRQEVTRAGLTAMSLVRGDVAGPIMTLFNPVMDKIINAEEIFLKAAAKK